MKPFPRETDTRPQRPSAADIYTSRRRNALLLAVIVIGCSGRGLEPDANDSNVDQCGDGVCGDTELCTTCARDCGVCGSVCGNANYAVPCGNGTCPSFSYCVSSNSCECQPGYRLEVCPGIRCRTPTGVCTRCVP